MNFLIKKNYIKLRKTLKIKNNWIVYKKNYKIKKEKQFWNN